MQTINKYMNKEYLHRISKQIKDASMKTVVLVITVCMLILFFGFAVKVENKTVDTTQMISTTVINNNIDPSTVSLVLFTTFSAPKEGEDDDVTTIQENTLHYMTLMTNIKPIVYTDSDYWITRCRYYKVTVINDYERNPYKLPYLFDMFERSMQVYPNEAFYGYINGDILVENSIHNVLVKVQEQINNHELSSKVGIFSQRHNFYFNSTEDMYTTKETRDELYTKQKLKARAYWDAAIDLFVFTPNAFKWRDMPKFVIGRAKFDNWIIQYVTRSEDVDSIDITFGAQIIHQTGKFGNRSGVKKLKTNLKESVLNEEIPLSEKIRSGDYERSKNHGWNNDVVYNMVGGCCEDIWFMEQSSHTLIPLNDNDMCFARKYTQTYFEDDYQYDETLILQKYIKPDMNCLILAEGSVNGYENRYCQHTTVLLFNLELCNFSKQRIESCPGLSENYTIICTGSRPDMYLDSYLQPLKSLDDSFDVVIVLIKTGKKLINTIYPYMNHKQIKDETGNVLGNNLLFIRRWNKQDIQKQFMIKAANKVRLIDINSPPVYMEGPHFPYLGLAVLTYTK